MAANAALCQTARATGANGTVSSTTAPARVQPAEVCTVDAAKQLGFDDEGVINLFKSNKDKMELYFDDCKNYGNYGNLNKASKHLCKPTVNSGEFTMNCTASTGGTVGFERKGDNCETVSCPPGFIKNTETGMCETKNVLKDYWRDKRALCQERWYDWFTVENYHLGNNYSNTTVEIMEEKQEGGITLKVLASNLVSCYSPCPGGTVPLYRRDPVDSDTMGDEIDKIEKCVSKTDYFTGKYKGTDDYCPLAAIHAITLTSSNIEATLNQQYDGIERNTEFEVLSNAVEEMRSNISKDKEYILSQSVKAANNIIINPKCADGNGCGNEYNARACSALESDPSRVEYAYRQCDILANYSPNTKRDKLIGNEEDYANRYLAHLGPTDRTKHLRNLKRSCNALFGDTAKSTAADAYPAAAESRIMFMGIDQTEVGDAVEDPYDPQFNQKPFEIMNYLPGTIKMGLLIAILPFVVWVLYLALTNLLIVFRWLRWKALRPVYKWGFRYIDPYPRAVIAWFGLVDSRAIVEAVTNIELDIGDKEDNIYFMSRTIKNANEMITKLNAKLEKLQLAAPGEGK